MQRVADRLHIGSLDDCNLRDGFAVVHACRDCHKKRCGVTKKGDEDHISDRKGHELWLNLLDPPGAALFEMAHFTAFLDFAKEEWRAGRDVLIHSVKGNSRCASLALVFMAKCLAVIESDTYDNAWDDFEDKTGTEYRPGKGIEAWLREHWSQIPVDRLPCIPGAAGPLQQHVTVPATAPGDSMEEIIAYYNSMTPEECEDLALSDPALHFAAFTRIRDKDGNLTAMEGDIEPNVGQLRLFEAYSWCLENQVSIRIVFGPKARQSGISTATSQLCLHHSQRFHFSGMMIADENDRTDKTWDMFNNMVDDDRVQHLWKVRHEWHSEKATFYYQDEDGTERSFQWERDTANDPKAGAGGTRQVLWFTEAGRYSKGGKVTDGQVISNASSSVPETPGTMIIMESTAEGSSGTFFETVKGAVTLEQRMAGKVGNGWIKVSCWWWEVPDYVLPRTPLNEEWFGASMDEREKRGVMLYHWTAEQIAWRRKKLAGPGFRGNINLFDQEFPESEEVAFSSSGNPRFHVEGMARLQSLALVARTAESGTLEQQPRGAVQLVRAIQGDGEVPWCHVYEPPMYEMSYLVFLDCMTGEQSAGSVERDEHACGVWKAPYMDKATGTFHDAELVAWIDHPDGVRWDEDIIAKRVHLLSQMYGTCIIVVEVNEGLGVLSKLISLGANLWKRTKADEASGIPGQTIKIPGWKTTPASKPIIVSEMAKWVREQQGRAPFTKFVHQLQVFVQYPNGACAAKPGEHDDWVMAAGIGLVCICAATKYSAPMPVTGLGNRPDRRTRQDFGKGAGAVG